MGPLDATERMEYLAQPHVGVLSVATSDGRPPLTVPIWYAYEPGGDLTFFTGAEGQRARKTRLLEEAGQFSFSVQRPEPPYRYVTVECTVTAADRHPPVADVLAITSRYLPAEAAMEYAQSQTEARSETFVLFRARPDRWLSFDFGED